MKGLSSDKEMQGRSCLLLFSNFICDRDSTLLIMNFSLYQYTETSGGA